MLVAFRMKTSPSRIADALLKNTPLEQSFNAHLEAIPISSIDFEHESILSGTFSEFSDDYLMLMLSAVEYEDHLRSNRKKSTHAHDHDAASEKKVEDHVSFEISVTNVDGTVHKQEEVMKRIMNVYSCASIEDSDMEHVKFIVSGNAPLFVQKSYIMPKTTFIMGGTTMARVLSEELIDAYHNKQRKLQLPGEQRCVLENRHIQ